MTVLAKEDVVEQLEAVNCAVRQRNSAEYFEAQGKLKSAGVSASSLLLGLLLLKNKLNKLSGG